ncbi:MAG: hypothetical protein GXP62_11890, partial [Oligoflexia bacterium]|nr:hypothetical protein [Oligoflexia bacterium]
MSLESALDLAERLVTLGIGGFDLGLLAVPTAADEARLARSLDQRLRARGIVLRHLDASALQPDPLAALTREPVADALLITGLHHGHRQLAARLNQQRDSLVRAWPVPWIAVCHPAGLRELVDSAPDFVDFASLHEVVQALPSPELPRLAGQADVATGWSFTGDPVRDRMYLAGQWDALCALLRADLAGRPGDPDTMVHLGDVLRRRGRPDEAVSLFERAVALFTEQGDVR